MSSDTPILMYVTAFLFKVSHAFSVMSSGFASCKAPSQSLRNRIPCILSFQKSKPVPSNLRISKRFLISDDNAAIVVAQRRGYLAEFLCKMRKNQCNSPPDSALWFQLIVRAIWSKIGRNRPKNSMLNFLRRKFQQANLGLKTLVMVVVDLIEHT